MINKVYYCLLLIGGLLLNQHVVYAQTRSYKRGLAYDIQSEKDIAAIAPGVSWFYNWDQKPKADKEVLDKYEFDFIPMAWNDRFSKENIRKFLSDNPHIKYILGFNEPNFTKEANMTPTQAAAKWHLVEEIADEFGLKIVGPAVNYAPSNGAVKEGGVTYTDPIKYLDDFFAARPESRVDYIAVHCYMNYIGSLKSYIDSFKKYGKPIWLTEHCGWEDGVTYSMQRNLLAESVLYLETNPDIYRYSWFIGRTDEEGEWPHMQLFENEEGKLTELGEIYVNMSSFDEDFYYQPDEIIPAASYIDGHQWTHLKRSSDVAEGLVVHEFEGGNAYGGKRWVTYQFETHEEGDYQIEVRYLPTTTNATLSATISNKTEQSGGAAAHTVNEWGVATFDFTLLVGKYRVKLETVSGKMELSWLKVVPKTVSGIGNEGQNKLSVYPNPVDDVLYLNGYEDIIHLLITDVAGKAVYNGAVVDGKVNIAQLHSGFYLLQAELRDGGKEALKIIKR